VFSKANIMQQTPAARRRAGAYTGISMAVLFALNAIIAGRLFHVDFTERMESIESSYMSISRWAMDHWNDRIWFPLWFGGSPFHRVYQPGLHLSVAELARILHWTPEHSYHFLTGLAYALGPVSLFWLCYRITGRKGYAFFAALLYSLISATTLFSGEVRGDMGRWLLPRRYQILVHYGEGPHTTALAMLPLVIWIIDGALSKRRWYFLLFAPLAVAAVILTNWPGTMGLGLAIAAYALATLDGPPRRWITLIGIGLLAYLIAIPWASPSIIALVIRNAQQSDGTPFNPLRLLLAGLFGLVLIAAHLSLRRTGMSPAMKFFFYFGLITGTVWLSAQWFHWQILPQAKRFQMEFDMAAAALAAYFVAGGFNRLPRRSKIAALVAAVLLFSFQARRCVRYARSYTRPIDITSTIEYRMAKWFDAHMQGERVFAPGNVSLWMNMFTEVPQMNGCCDQGIPSQEDRIANYAIYTGQNAGKRDAEISVLWLKAFGAAAIGVTGPQSTEYFKPYWNPHKFDGVLPLLWREGDNAIYRVALPSYSLAHALDQSVVVGRAPANGLDVGPLEPLVAALDDEKPPFTSFRWIDQHEARIEAVLKPGDIVFVQMTYERGWRATEGGTRLAVTPDALGLMEIHPTHTGKNVISLIYDGGPEAIWTRWAQLAGILLLVTWGIAAWTSEKKAFRERLKLQSGSGNVEQ
jgi:hypothetical protein